MEQPDLIEGRSCGTCMVCCVIPGIDQKDVQKRFNTPCTHAGVGCRMYDQRPGVCRKFYCAWRYLVDWDEFQRPDISGIFASFEPSPDGPGVAISILLTNNPTIVVQDPLFLRCISSLAAAGVPL